MSRKRDVDTVLAAARSQHEDVTLSYEQALHDKTLDLRVDVKNLMENLRSALDYMAHDIYETSCRPALVRDGKSEPRRIYFPYGRTELDFKSAMGSSLPGLAVNRPDVFDVVQSVQPFSSGDGWLCDLCSILNESKHDKLTPQTRSQTETHSVEHVSGASVTVPVNNPNIQVTSIPGAVRVFGVPAQFGSAGIRTVPSPELKHKRVTWVAFMFADTGVNVLALLDKSVAGVASISGRLYRSL